MKKIVFIISIFFVLGCDSKKSIDCIQASGNIIEQEFEISRFKTIVVGKGVSLFISQGETRSVVFKTGENLMEEVSAYVVNDTLWLNDFNTCNLVRDYEIIQAFVTTPTIKEIKNRSGLDINSIGLISFPDLALVSDDPDGLGEVQANGDFIFDNLDVYSLRVNANGISKYFLKGKVFNASFSAVDSDVRIDASELEIQHLLLFHRSTNKMIVNPQQSIKGKIVGLGDVISLNQPPIVNVEELFTGKLIFQ